MKSVFWILILAALAVALALLLGDNRATVSVYWHPWRLDMSLNLVLFALLATFVLLHISLRGVAILRALPVKAQRWRSRQQERGVYLSLLDAMVHQLSGRFVRAQAASKQALQLLDRMAAASMERSSRWRVLAQLMLAESSRALGNTEQQGQAIQAALAESGNEAAPAQEGALLRALAWAIEDRDAEQARHWLGQLSQGASRRILAVRLRLRLAQLEHDASSAVEMVRLLAKHKAFSPAVADSLLKGLLKEALTQCHDSEQLLQTWKGFDARERSDPGLALICLERWRNLSSPNAAPTDRGAQAYGLATPGSTPHSPYALQRHILDVLLLTVWQSYPQLAESRKRRFVRWFESQLDVLAPDWLQRLEEAQRTHPTDAELQYLSGQVLMQCQLWGKAHQLLTQAARQLSDTDLQRRAWYSLAVLAEQRGDETQAAAAWKRAASL